MVGVRSSAPVSLVLAACAFLVACSSSSDGASTSAATGATTTTQGAAGAGGEGSGGSGGTTSSTSTGSGGSGGATGTGGTGGSGTGGTGGSGGAGVGGSGGAGGCLAADAWSPAETSETDPTGQQFNQTIDEPVRMEVQQKDAGLEFRVCKQNGTFIQDVYVNIADLNVGKASWSGTMTTTGMSCSAWTALVIPSPYASGDVFGGGWALVSPSTSAADWGSSHMCSPIANATGSCWTGVSLTMTRTCK